jgi:hypothetical protein
MGEEQSLEFLAVAKVDMHTCKNEIRSLSHTIKKNVCDLKVKPES